MDSNNSLNSSQPFSDFPIKQEISVIPGDSGKLRLNWTVTEYQGTETFNLSAFFRDGCKIGGVSEVPNDGWVEGWSLGCDVDHGIEVNYPNSEKPVVVSVSRAALQIGDWLIVQGLMGYDLAKVTEIHGNEAWAASSGCLWPLKFGEDDRGCWVCTDQINKACFGPDCKIDFEI